MKDSDKTKTEEKPQMAQWDNGRIRILRPHHCVCLLFFEGKGYSGSFTKNMAYILENLEKDLPDICLEIGPDSICASCPHLQEGVCDASEKTTRYDRAVLDMIAIHPGEVISWERVKETIKNSILIPGRRFEICGDCQWDDVCASACRRALES